jgi:PAS domain S-box-containing protein
MNKCFICPAIFLIILTHSVYAQYTPMDRCVRDSLYRIMPHSSRIQKAEIYLELAPLIWDTVPLQAFSDIVTALQISISENNVPLKARSRLVMGLYFESKRNFMQAQEHYLAAGKIYKSCRDTLGELNFLTHIGILNRTLANYDKALYFFQKGLNLAKKAKNPEQTGKFLENVGITYQSLGNYIESMHLFLEAQAAYRQSGDRNNEFNMLNHIGSIYLDQENYDLALPYYKDLIKKADTGNCILMSSLYTRIGHIYFQKKDYLNSLNYNKKALSARQRIRVQIDVTSSLINIGGDFYMLGNADSGKFYFDKGLRLALHYDRKNLVENAYRHLYRYYLNIGDYKLALENYRKFVSVDSILKQERNNSNISILEANQQVQQVRESGNMLLKQHQIQSLNMKNQKYQFTFVRILTGLASVLMIGFVFQFLNVRRVRRDMQNLNVLLSDEIKEREATERHTREREQQYRFLSENSVDFITHMDSEKNRIYASPASMRVYGYEPDEMLQLSPQHLTHPDFNAYGEAKFAEMLETRSSQQFIYKAKRKNGEFFWAESMLNPLFDPVSGMFKGMVGVTRDIQERKTKELEIMEGTKQKENLLKEIHHRVKNNFAILVSLINMQMAQTKNPELMQSLTNLQLRIRTMALVHEMLYRSKDFENISFSDYLRSLASVIAGTYNRRDIALKFEADGSVMDIEASIPLGLIVNEILSNSYKHAFPGDRPGNIWITFKVDHENGKYCLMLQDDGIGLPDNKPLDQYKSMGLQVVYILCQQIEGTLEMINDHGVTFNITFKPAYK